MDFINKIFELDFSSLVPDMGMLLDKAQDLVTVSVLVGPLVLILLGLLYMFKSPKEANHSFGYRTYFGMGSVEAWQFTQRVAGILWSCMGFLLSIIMLLVCGGFSPTDGLDMVSTAGTCLIWELVLIGGLCLFIDVVVILRYDRKGNRRPKVAFTIPDKFLSFPKPRAEKPQEPQSPDLPQQ